MAGVSLEIAKARIAMRRGHSLMEAAHLVGVDPADLDQALWGAIGGEPLEDSDAPAAVPVRPWTGAEQRRLRAAYGSMSAKRIARKLGRTVPAIHKRAVVLGLTEPGRRR